MYLSVYSADLGNHHPDGTVTSVLFFQIALTLANAFDHLAEEQQERNKLYHREIPFQNVDSHRHHNAKNTKRKFLIRK